MSNVASKGFVLFCMLGLLITVLVLQFVLYGRTARTTSAGAGTGDVDPASTAGPFTIEGSLTEPISPGVSAPLNLRLTNPHSAPMSVTQLRVTVQKVSAPNADVARPCTIADFAVDQASGGIEIGVPARATSTLSTLGLARATMPQVGMLDRSVNQDGCKGASLTLAYTAVGTPER
jgi:hypothetical protein